MGDVRRVPLADPLEGQWIDVDVAAITLGMLEDIESFQKVGLVLDALAGIITATSMQPPGPVPEGMSPVRAVLRGLRPPALGAVVQGITRAGDIPKAS